MTHTNSIKAALLTCIIALSTACSPGFEAGSTSSSASGGGTPGAAGGATGDTTSPGWNGIDVDGSINGGRFDSANVVSLDKAAKMLVLRVPFIPGFLIGAEVSRPISEIPGATIGIEMNTDGSSSIVLRLPLAKLLKGVNTLPVSRLPNGDALPAIPDGELPAVGVSFNRAGTVRGALYLSPAVVGLFVSTKFDPFIRLTLPIRNAARTRTYGYFTSIPAKSNFDGGFFLSIALPDDLARAIDNLL